MIRFIAAVAAISLMAVSSARAQTAAAAPVAGTSAATAAETHLRLFFSKLQAGQPNEAVDALLGGSTGAQKPGERENLLAQLNAAVQAYGPVMSYEKARSDSIGSMVLRQFYLVQHRDMVVRWEFHLVRAGTGWRIEYFGFDDQPRTWF